MSKKKNKMTPEQIVAWAKDPEKLETGKQERVMGTLNPKQELFCQLYSTDMEFFGHGTNSYMQAYGLTREQENTARTNASLLLTNPNILARVRELMDLFMSDEVADKELAFVVLQRADLNAKVSALREYNKLKARITEKIDHTSGGEKIVPIYGGHSVPGHDSNTKDIQP